MYVIGAHHGLHAVDSPLDCAPLFSFGDTGIEILNVAQLSVEFICIRLYHARHFPQNFCGNVRAGHVVVGYV